MASGLHPNLERAVFTSMVLLLCLLGSASADCSQGSEWIEYNGNCYHWTRSVSNWFNAELTCQKFGGHLVSINSTSENNFLLRLTQCGYNIWIGMVNTDHSLKTHVRGYQWWDRTQHSYTALNPSGSSYTDCVYFHVNGHWYPNYCQTGNGYVCMAPAAVHQQQAKKQKNPGDMLSIFKPRTTVNAEEATASSRMWPTTPSTSLKCLKDWQLIDSSCYFISDGKTNYFNAQMSCQAMGASVSSVLTPREHTLLTVALGCNSPTWIGLEKARPCFRQLSKDHCWLWMDKSPLSYLGWVPGQDLNQAAAECVVLDDQWKVKNCYAEFRYICKRPAH